MLNADRSPVNSRIQSIDRAVELLEAIAGAPEPETTPVLADRCGLNRSTAWRILATLEHHGLVERDPDSNRYSLGFAVLKLAAAAGHEPLVRLAHPVLRRLADATGETVNLAVARRLELVYADQVQARHVMAPNWLGHPVPLHATSTGKAFLAWLPAGEVHGLLDLPLPRYTDSTVTDPDCLMSELDDIRERGYAECAGELEPALYGVSAPILNLDERQLGVFSIWGPVSRVPVSRFLELGPLAVEAAEEVREALLS